MIVVKTSLDDSCQDIPHDNGQDIPDNNGQEIPDSGQSIPDDSGRGIPDDNGQDIQDGNDQVRSLRLKPFRVTGPTNDELTFDREHSLLVYLYKSYNIYSSSAAAQHYASQCA